MWSDPAEKEAREARRQADRERYAERDARRRATVWNGQPPNPKARALQMSDIRKCPTLRMDVPHFRPDGTCMCVPPRDESLEPHLIRGEN